MAQISMLARGEISMLARGELLSLLVERLEQRQPSFDECLECLGFLQKRVRRVQLHKTKCQSS